MLGNFSFLLFLSLLFFFFLFGLALVKVLSHCLCLGALVYPSTLLLIVLIHLTDPLPV